MKVAARQKPSTNALYSSTALKLSAREMLQANLDSSVIMFSMWTEAVKNFAEYGKGNIIFLDGSPDGMEKVMKQMMGMNQMMDKR